MYSLRAMTILVAGNLGYRGAVFTRPLVQRGHRVRGLAAGFFRNYLLGTVVGPAEQIVKDIRDIEREDLSGTTAVVHLTGL